MAAGLSDTLWSMTDLAEMVDAAPPKPGKRGPYKKEIAPQRGRAVIRLACFCTGLLAISFSSAFGEGPYGTNPLYSANSYLPGCKDYLQQKSNVMTGRCIGVVEGLGVVAGHIYCPPETGTTDRHIRVILLYIEARPDRMNEDFRMLALEALRDAWPCQR
jgi:hypothetical protein